MVVYDANSETAKLVSPDKSFVKHGHQKGFIGVKVADYPQKSLLTTPIPSNLIG
jgi:hypothetical protein